MHTPIEGRLFQRADQMLAEMERRVTEDPFFWTITDTSYPHREPISMSNSDKSFLFSDIKRAIETSEGGGVSVLNLVEDLYYDKEVSPYGISGTLAVGESQLHPAIMDAVRLFIQTSGIDIGYELPTPKTYSTTVDLDPKEVFTMRVFFEAALERSGIRSFSVWLDDADGKRFEYHAPTAHWETHYTNADEPTPLSFSTSLFKKDGRLSVPSPTFKEMRVKLRELQKELCDKCIPGKDFDEPHEPPIPEGSIVFKLPNQLDFRYLFHATPDNFPLERKEKTYHYYQEKGKWVESGFAGDRRLAETGMDNPSEDDSLPTLVVVQDPELQKLFVKALGLNARRLGVDIHEPDGPERM